MKKKIQFFKKVMQCISIVSINALPFRTLQTLHHPIFIARTRALDKNENQLMPQIGGLFSE
jgi:hypothetical protein